VPKPAHSTIAFTLLQRRGGVFRGPANPAHQRADRALQQGDQPHVEEAPLEEEEKGQGEVDALVQREPDGAGQVGPQRQLQKRLRSVQRAVPPLQPAPVAALHAGLRRAVETGFVADQRLDHGLALVDAHPDPERHDEGQVLQPFPPGDADLALAGDVEQHHADSGGPEERKIQQQHLIPAVLEADHHAHRHQHGEQDHQRVREIRAEVEEGLHLHLPGEIAAQDPWQQLARGLDAALRPAVLLGLESVHFHRHFRRRDDLGQVDEPPASELRAIAEVQVLRQRVVLPPAGILDGRATPDARGAVEIEEPAAAVARRVLDDEVPVEEDGLCLGQVRVLAVEMLPADLHHADPFVSKEVDRAPQELRGWHEVRVEHRHQFAMRDLQSFLEGTGLVSLPAAPVEVGDVHTLLPEPGDLGPGDALRLVRGVVQDLDFEPVAGVVDAGDRVDQALHDIHLIEDG